MSKIVQYEHHGANVSVMEENKGKHREHCLCYSCDLFNDDPDKTGQCPVAESVYQNCVTFGIVTPIWECPYFQAK